MLVVKKKKYVIGRGFIDTMTSAFSALKSAAVPAIKGTMSYISENKDLIAKPILGALGAVGATALTVGVPALLSHIARRNRKMPPEEVPQNAGPNEEKYREILNNILRQNDSKSGSGIKTF